MTLILAILALFGMIKAVETMSSSTALIGNQVYFSVTGWLKLNWGLILKIATVLVAYHISSYDEVKGLAFMAMLTIEGNPYMDNLRHDLKESLNEVRFWTTGKLTKNPSYVQYLKDVPVIRIAWDLRESKQIWSGARMDIPVNAFTDAFEGDIYHLEGLWSLKMEIKQAFLNSIFAKIKAEGKYFHMTEKTRECMLYVGTPEQFEKVLGVRPKSTKFKKTLAAIYSVVERYTVKDLPASLNLVVVDSDACGYPAHNGDGEMGLFYQMEYSDEHIKYNVGAVQARIHRKPGGIIKACCAFGHVSALRYKDILRYMDKNLPMDVDGYLFIENIKGGFTDIKHGDIIKVTREELIIIKKAKAPGHNNSSMGGQLQIATVAQSKEFKAALLAKSPVHHALGLMKEVWETGSLDALYELGFSKGMDIEKILNRLMFENMRDNRTVVVHKNAIYKTFIDRVRKTSHADKSFSVYATSNISLSLAEKYHYEKYNRVVHFALTPDGCDVESLAVRYPAASNHSAVALTPVHEYVYHDVVTVAASTPEWISWQECNFGDWDGDMLAIYRNVVGYENIKPGITVIATEKPIEPADYINGIIGASNAAIIAKASISESDRAVRKGFMYLFVNMYEGRVKLSRDMLIKLVQDTASMREQFIKSQKRTEINGKQASIAKVILSMFPQPDVPTSELGTRAAEILFELTTADGGIGSDKMENEKLDHIVHLAKMFMSSEFAKYHPILKSMPFIQNICTFSQFANLDYETLDVETLQLMNMRGNGIMAEYSQYVDMDKMKKIVRRIGWLVQNFNEAMKQKHDYDMCAVLANNPLFKHVTIKPNNEERWSIQADGVRKYFEAVAAKATEEEIMAMIGLTMTGWDDWDRINKIADKFEGFSVYMIASGHTFRRRGHIFWMMPKMWIARVALSVASRDEEGLINNPFLFNAETPFELVEYLNNFIDERAAEVYETTEYEPYLGFDLLDYI